MQNHEDSDEELAVASLPGLEGILAMFKFSFLFKSFINCDSFNYFFYRGNYYAVIRLKLHLLVVVCHFQTIGKVRLLFLVHWLCQRYEKVVCRVCFFFYNNITSCEVYLIRVP